MSSGNVSGSLATLIVGVLEFLDTLVDLGVYAYEIAQKKGLFSTSTGFIAIIITYGVYILLAFIATFLLIYSTFSSKGLYVRKCICVGWIIFRIFSFIITIIAIVAGSWWNDKTLMTMACVSLVMWVVFVGIVAYYTAKLGAALQEKKKRTVDRKILSKRQVNVATPKPQQQSSSNNKQQVSRQPWSKGEFQLVRKEHVFSSNHQHY